jgi:uncharacterized coiled-coil protein SlyX
MELRYMEQQAVIDALDGVVREQDAALEFLRREVDRLKAVLAGGGEDGDGAPWED